jgi:hypothetical protein
MQLLRRKSYVMRMIVGGVAFMAASAAVSPVRAQSRGGRSAAILLELPSSPRALSLGGAYAALGSDEASIFYNPAQLATLTASSAGFSVQSYIQSSALGAFAAAMPMGPGHLGVGVQVLNYGSEDRYECDVTAFPTCEHGVKTGTVSASDLAASVGYAMMFRRVRFGGTLKYIRQNIADETGGAPAFDLGAAMDIGLGATFGVSVQNLGGRLTLGSVSGALPRAFRFGAALPRQHIGPLDITATAEVAQWSGGGTVPAGGAEVSWLATNGISLLGRVGAQSLTGETQASPLTFGGGVAARHLAFDLIGGATHRIGVRFWR